MKTLLFATVGVIALIVNPFFACDRDDDDEFHYTVADMRAAVEGTWRLRLPPEHGMPARDVRFSIAQGDEPHQQARRSDGFVQQASACEYRSFVRSAAACSDESHMPLDVKLLAGVTPTRYMTGHLVVWGTVFYVGQLDLDVGGVEVTAWITPTGVATHLGTSAGDLPGIALLRVRR